MEDERKILKEKEPFSFRITKNGLCFIYYNQREIMTLKGKRLEKIRHVLESDNSYDIQIALAKVTGNFKHGNER